MPPTSLYANARQFPKQGPSLITVQLLPELPAVTGADGPITYVIHSDVPEPASLLLPGAGLVGLGATHPR